MDKREEEGELIVAKNIIFSWWTFPGGTSMRRIFYLLIFIHHIFFTAPLSPEDSSPRSELSPCAEVSSSIEATLPSLLFSELEPYFTFLSSTSVDEIYHLPRILLAQLDSWDFPSTAGSKSFRKFAKLLSDFSRWEPLQAGVPPFLNNASQFPLVFAPIFQRK